MVNSKRKPVTKRIKARRATLRRRARPVLRCVTCLIVGDATPEGFECGLTRCPRKFRRVALQNGVIVIK